MKFCKVADIVDWQDEAFQAIAAFLGLQVKNRKVWEFIQVYLGLERLGQLQGQAKALGLGVGHEPLIYAFAKQCQRVVATDLYESEVWATAAMAIQEVYEQSPFPYPRERLDVRHMDMTQIEYADNSFDFVWSCCAVEYVHNFQALYQVYQEIHRVLKPGGIAAITTEFNVTDLPCYEPTMLFTDRHWMQTWLTGEQPLIQGFELVEPVDYTLTAHPDNQPVSRRSPDDGIQVYCNDVILNSIAFFLRKTGAFSGCYSATWLDPDWRTYLAACDAYRDKQYEQSETLLRQLLETDLPVRIRFRALRRLADALQAQGNLEAVKTVCETALSYAPQITDHDHLMPFAYHCRRVGLLNEALMLCRQVADLPGVLAPSIEKNYRLQAQCLKQQGYYTQALTVIQQAEALQPSEPQQLAWLKGNCYQAMGQLDEAIYAYEIAIQLAPAQEAALRERCLREINKCLEFQLSQTRQQLAQLQDSRLLQTYESLRSMGRTAKRWLRQRD